jgi:hypothetical protein
LRSNKTEVTLGLRGLNTEEAARFADIALPSIANTSASEIFASDETQLKRMTKGAERLASDDTRMQYISATIQRWNDDYTGMEVHVHAAFKCTKGQYIATVKGAQFCQNIQKCHPHNSVYFVFSKNMDGIVKQFCFCQRNDPADECLNGPCPKYESRHYRLPGFIARAFWPPVNQAPAGHSNHGRKRQRFA